MSYILLKFDKSNLSNSNLETTVTINCNKGSEYDLKNQLESIYYKGWKLGWQDISINVVEKWHFLNSSFVEYVLGPLERPNTHQRSIFAATDIVTSCHVITSYFSYHWIHGKHIMKFIKLNIRMVHIEQTILDLETGIKQRISNRKIPLDYRTCS